MTSVDGYAEEAAGKIKYLNEDGVRLLLEELAWASYAMGYHNAANQCKTSQGIVNLLLRERKLLSAT
jgi:hypothetical protein